MAKKNIRFPQSCMGCDGIYTHWDNIKLYSGGIMKSFGNKYCTKGKKHFKLLMRNINYLRPTNCPIREQFPIIYEEE